MGKLPKKNDNQCYEQRQNISIKSKRQRRQSSRNSKRDEEQSKVSKVALKKQAVKEQVKNSRAEYKRQKKMGLTQLQIDRMKRAFAKIVPRLDFDKAVSLLYQQSRSNNDEDQFTNQQKSPGKLKRVPRLMSLNAYQNVKEEEGQNNQNQKEKFKQLYFRTFIDQNQTRNCPDQIISWDEKTKQDYINFIKCNGSIMRYYDMAKDKRPISYEQIQKYRREDKLHIKDKTQKLSIDQQQLMMRSGNLDNNPPTYLDPVAITRFFSLFQNKNYILYRSACKVQRSLYMDVRHGKQGVNGILIKTDGELAKLMHIRQIIICFMAEGYNIIATRRHLNNYTLRKQKYKVVMLSCMRIIFRLLQKFIRQYCGKMIPKVNYKNELSLLATPLFNGRHNFDQQTIDTLHKVLKMIFDIGTVQSISKNEVINLFYTFKKKIVQRENIKNQYDMARCKSGDKQRRPRNIQPLPYCAYGDGGQTIVPGFQAGIHAIDNIYEILNGKKLKIWNQQFQLQALKLYIKYRKLSSIRQALRQRYQKNKQYSNEFQLQTLKCRYQKIVRKVVKFMQYELRFYLKLTNQSRINYAQKKFLSLSKNEKSVVIARQHIDMRCLCFDYFLHNAYRQRKLDEREWIYPITYINYALESIVNILQTKRYLHGILTQAEQDRYKDFDIDVVDNAQWLYDHSQKIQKNTNFFQIVQNNKEKEKALLTKNQKLKFLFNAMKQGQLQAIPDAKDVNTVNQGELEEELLNRVHQTFYRPPNATPVYIDMPGQISYDYRSKLEYAGLEEEEFNLDGIQNKLTKLQDFGGKTKIEHNDIKGNLNYSRMRFQTSDQNIQQNQQEQQQVDLDI